MLSENDLAKVCGNSQTDITLLTGDEFTRILHGIRYCSEPKIYVVISRMADKNKSKTLMKWMFSFVMSKLKEHEWLTTVEENNRRTVTARNVYLCPDFIIFIYITNTIIFFSRQETTTTTTVRN